MRRGTALVAGMVVTVGAAASSCAQPQVEVAQDAPAFRGAPQPPGAVLDSPGEPPEEAFDSNFKGWPGSLRPGEEEERDGTHMRRIRERGRIIVGVDQSQYLLSYRDASRGELRGFEVDLAREVARDIFGDPERVDFRFVDSAGRAEALRAGAVDIVIRTMSVTPGRAAQVDFPPRTWPPTCACSRRATAGWRA